MNDDRTLKELLEDLVEDGIDDPEAIQSVRELIELGLTDATEVHVLRAYGSIGCGANTSDVLCWLVQDLGITFNEENLDRVLYASDRLMTLGLVRAQSQLFPADPYAHN